MRLTSLVRSMKVVSLQSKRLFPYFDLIIHEILYNNNIKLIPFVG